MPSYFFKGHYNFRNIVPNLPYDKAVVYAGDRNETRDDIQIVPIFKIYELLNRVQ